MLVGAYAEGKAQQVNSAIGNRRPVLSPQAIREFVYGKQLNQSGAVPASDRVMWLLEFVSSRGA
jgi:hypothetical protein